MIFISIVKQKETLEEILKEYTEEEELINEISNKIIIRQAELTTKENSINKKGIEIKRKITDFEKTLINNFGNFFFNFYINIPVKLERQYKFRFIYICTFLTFEDNRLKIKLNNKFELMNEEQLKKYLNLSEREYYKTKKELIDYNLIKFNENNIEVNNKISIVGTINNKTKKEYTRIFKNSIYELYNRSLAREHKRLGLFIDLLPYVHYKFNIICKNPSCELMQDIEVITLKELAGILKYKNSSELKTQLLNIFVAEEKTMLLVEDFNKRFFIVNPRIYFKGSRTEQLTYLTNLFRI